MYTVEQNTMHGLLFPGEDFNYMKDTKDHLYANHREEKSKHFCLLLLGITVTHKAVKHWVEQNFTYGRDRARSTSVVDIGPWRLLSSPVSRQPSPGNLPTRMPLLEGCCPLPEEDRHKSGVGKVPYDTTIKQNKGTYIELVIGEDIPMQGNKPSTGCAGSLSLGKKVF